MKKEKLTSRQIKALDTKKALFMSAIKLFKEKGFENVHIEEIAADAGTSKGSFYTYYKSKDEVIIEHYFRIDEHYISVYEKMDKNGSPSKMLATLFDSGFRFAEQLSVEFLKIVTINQVQKKHEDAYVISDQRKLHQIVLEIVLKGQKSGEFNEDIPAEELSTMVLCFYRGQFLDWCYTDGGFDLVERGNKFMKRFINNVLKNMSSNYTFDSIL